MFKKFTRRRNSDIPSVPVYISHVSQIEPINEHPYPNNSPRRHSLPETQIDKSLLVGLNEQALYTINESENMSTKSPNMSLSPNPKEKRSFQILRSRTLSSSSTGSNDGVNSNGTQNFISPRLSPRSLFDKVRKRSQSDVKASNSVDQINGNLNAFQQNLQKHLQEQLLKDQQQKAKEELSNGSEKPTPPQVRVINGHTVSVAHRKHLSHSISEETNDDENTQNNEAFGNNGFQHHFAHTTTNKPVSDAMKIDFSNQRTMPSKHKISPPDIDSTSSQTDLNSIDKLLKMSKPIPSSPSADRVRTASRQMPVPGHGYQHASPRNSPLSRSALEQLKKLSSSHPSKPFFDINNTGFTQIENNQIFSYFMKHKFCYDIMPKSAKVVVFDTQLLVKKAFFALIYNGVRSAPLWDSKNQKFIGMLTITDFILILQKYYREANAKIEELEEHRLETWREVLKEYTRPFIYLRPEDTLFDAIQALSTNKVHRLPIIDRVTGNVVCIMTHKRILRYLYLFIYDMPQPEFVHKSIADLNLGTFDNIKTIRQDTRLMEALNLFVSTRVSALPVVDDQGKLVNIYSKFDVIDLAAEKTYTNLDVTVTEALNYRSSRFSGVASCQKNESLSTIMERIVKKEVHRLVVVDAENKVTGVISLSDILTFIVLNQDSLNQNSNNATASLTTAFGLTRLSSSIDHVESNPSGNHKNGGNNNSKGSVSAHHITASGSASSVDNLNDSNGSSLNSGGSSPMATATVQQPRSSSIDQAIFEDDPMELSANS